MKLETLALRSTMGENGTVRFVSTPMYLSTTFERNEDGSFERGFRYSRLDNPNRRILEKSLAKLEKGKAAFAFSSGMGAISAIFQSLRTGDHVLLPDDVFFNVRMLINDIFKPWGLESTFIDMSNLKKVKDSIKENTALIWAETPSNPLLKIVDIAALSKIAKEHGLLMAVDNTWSTPILQNPIELGADVVMHSTTKYFGGHSDVTGGCLILKKNNSFAHRIRQIQLLAGAIPSPFDCWLVCRGIKTLSLRVRAQSEAAFLLASYLEKHPEIERVNYAGLESHPQHFVAKKQMKNGFGAMLSVLVKGGKKRTLKVADKLKLFKRATSLGGVESLVEHRESVEGPETKTPGNLLRISVGLEHIDDLIADLEQALK